MKRIEASYCVHCGEVIGFAAWRESHMNGECKDALQIESPAALFGIRAARSGQEVREAHGH